MSLPPPALDPHPPQPQPQPHPHPHPRLSRQPKSPVATSPPPCLVADVRGNSLPFSLTRSIQPNPSSTSIVPSVAEGRPIPLDDSTAEYRTTALRELNHHYPSRHRYAKSTGAQNSTYSEPVIVRSYYAAPSPPSRPSASSRASRVHSGAASTAGSSTSRSASAASRGLPFSNKFVVPGNGKLSTMVLARGKKPVNGRTEEEARLPPVEAFTFKSFIANIEAQGGGGSVGDINADLDRIAEICARSRYSLSNQYEVHFSPHGSGSSFSASAAQPNEPQGPTLQAVTSDDERNAGCSRRRRRMVRRNSRAMGTLETIMSSSRSSDEERSADKPAAEVADEVRGRASVRDSHSSTSNCQASPKANLHSDHPSEGTPERRSSRLASPLPPPRSPAGSKKSMPPLALIDGARHSTHSLDQPSPHSSSTNLVSQLALPQASASQLETKTIHGPGEHCALSRTLTLPRHPGVSVAKGAINPGGADTSTGILSMINGWIPWRTSSADHPRGLAEGSLRELLRSADGSGSKHPRAPVSSP